MSDSIPVRGTVHTVLPTQEFPSGFKKRVLVVKTHEDKYPQFIPVEFVKDKTLDLDGLMPNQHVTVLVNLRGNEHNGKYYLSCQGWKLEKGKMGEAPPTKEEIQKALDVTQEIPY